jgi:hypothetical protein
MSADGSFICLKSVYVLYITSFYISFYFFFRLQHSYSYRHTPTLLASPHHTPNISNISHEQHSHSTPSQNMGSILSKLLAKSTSLQPPQPPPKDTPTTSASPTPPRHNVKDGVVPPCNTPMARASRPGTSSSGKGGYYDVGYNWKSEREDMVKSLA